MNENIELCGKLLIVWSMNQSNDKVMFGPEYEQHSFIAKVLRKKLEVFKINVKLPDPLIMLIEICTESNPGISQLMLKEILTKVKSRKKLNPDVEYVITPDDFSLTYPNEFPVMDNSPSPSAGLPPFMKDAWKSLNPSTSNWEEYFHKAWDAQKDENDGHNKCDTPEWWWEIYS